MICDVHNEEWDQKADRQVQPVVHKTVEKSSFNVKSIIQDFKKLISWSLSKLRVDHSSVAKNISFK